MKKINILYIDEISQISGGENWFLNYIDGIDSSELRPFLLCPEGPFAESARRKNVTVVTYDFKHFDLTQHRLTEYLLFVAHRLKDAIRIKSIVKKNNIDIVHSINTNGHVIASLLKSLFSIKSLWHIHHDHSPKLYKFFNPDYYVFVAEIRKQLLTTARLDHKIKGRHSVLYNGINTNDYKKDNGNGFKIFGFIGRLHPDKGVEIFIEAAGILLQDHPELKFHIYGKEIYDEKLKGKYTETLQNKIQHLGLGEAVELKGFVFPPEKIYSAIDVFIMPSLRLGESCPMVILESWASGIPVIATDAGGIPELIKNGETGFLIPKNKPHAIVEKINHLLSHKKSVQEIIDYSRTYVKMHFDNKKHAQDFIKIYRAILSE